MQKQPPKPLLEPEKLHSQNDWLEAGRMVYQELYLAIGFSDLIPLVRSAATLKQAKMIGKITFRRLPPIMNFFPRHVPLVTCHGSLLL